MSNRDKTILTFSVFLSILIVNIDSSNGVNRGLLDSVRRVAVLTAVAYVLSWGITFVIGKVLWDEPKK